MIGQGNPYTIKGTQEEVKRTVAAFLVECDLKNLISITFQQISSTEFSATIVYRMGQ